MAQVQVTFSYKLFGLLKQKMHLREYLWSIINLIRQWLQLKPLFQMQYLYWSHWQLLAATDLARVFCSIIIYKHLAFI